MEDIKILEEYILTPTHKRDEFLQGIANNSSIHKKLLMLHILQTRPYDINKKEFTNFSLNYKLQINQNTTDRLKKILIDIQTLVESPSQFKDFPALTDEEKKVRLINPNKIF